MATKKPTKGSASRKTKKSRSADPVRSEIDKFVDKLVSAGVATRLSKEEWAKIRDNSDAHGCILVPKDSATRGELSNDTQN